MKAETKMKIELAARLYPQAARYYQSAIPSLATHAQVASVALDMAETLISTAMKRYNDTETTTNKKAKEE